MDTEPAKDITVIITTANRPKDLAKALASVARQTAISPVLEILVIENGGCRNSESVCNTYWQLPIRYVLNTPPRPVSRYLNTTFIESAPHGDYIALLHDDDYWLPEHLASSVATLARHHAAASSYTMPLLHREDGSTGTYGGFFPWLVSGHQCERNPCLASHGLRDRFT
jgi:glycosyltransferase involved in cell wall biosynthesis